MRATIRKSTWIARTRFVLILCAVCSAPAAAEVITVTSPSSSALRDAIASALSGDEITFDPAIDGEPIQLGFLDIRIDKDVTITGRNTILDGDGQQRRLFYVESGVTAVLSGLAIRNGHESRNRPDQGSTNERGGAILNYGDLTLDGCSLSDSEAGFGGAIANFGTLTVSNSTLRDNLATERGSAIYNDGPLVSLVNTTISGNYGGPIAYGIVSGAIFTESGVVELDSCTVTDNDGGILNTSLVRLENTIIADPSNGSDCGFSGPIESQGHNLDSDDTCGLTQATDIVAVDPWLDFLQDNGGFPMTHALAEGSPAVDAGSCGGLDRDQRGASRPFDEGSTPDVDDGCDIGAFERNPSVTSDGSLVLSCPSPLNGNVGMTWDGSHLWVAGDSDRAHRIDPETCQSDFSIPLPGGVQPTGLAWDGEFLWSGSRTPAAIHRLDPADGSVVSSFDTETNQPPVDLVWDGVALWSMESSSLVRYSPSGTVLLEAPGIFSGGQGLTYDGERLWLGNGSSDKISRLRFSDLSMQDSFPTRSTLPTGLAWDGRYLWVVDNRANRFFKYDVGLPDLLDADDDGLLDNIDNCPATPNAEQTDTVHPNGIGDACDDPDGDGVFDSSDNCPDDTNPGQDDEDGDGSGNACDSCPGVANPDQEETVACLAAVEDGGQCLEVTIDLAGEPDSGELLVIEQGTELPPPGSDDGPGYSVRSYSEGSLPGLVAIEELENGPLSLCLRSAFDQPRLYAIGGARVSVLDVESGMGSTVGFVANAFGFQEIEHDDVHAIGVGTTGQTLRELRLADATAPDDFVLTSNLTALEWIDSTLYGVRSSFQATLPSTLVIVSPDTGETTTIGSTGIGSIFGLAHLPETGETFGIAFASLQLGFQLVSVDLETGEATPIGPLSIGPSVAQLESFEAGADGKLYGGTASGRLYRVNKETGAVTLVGSGLGRLEGLALVSTAGMRCVDVMRQGEEDLAVNGAACGKPAAEAGPDRTVECETPAGAGVTLDGSASTDPNSTLGTNDDIVAFEWFEANAASDPVELGAGEILETILDLGVHEVTLRVTDTFGEQDEDDTVQTVVDTIPPEISAPPVTTLECTLPGGVPASDPSVLEWLASMTVVDACGDANLQNDLPAVIGLGSTAVTLTAIDRGGNTATADSVLDVVDTTAPAVLAEFNRASEARPRPITAHASTGIAGPPGRGFIENYRVVVEVEDSCDAEPELDVRVRAACGVSRMLPGQIVNYKVATQCKIDVLQGTLSIRAPYLELVVTAEDAHGNRTLATDVLGEKSPDPGAAWTPRRYERVHPGDRGQR